MDMRPISDKLDEPRIAVGHFFASANADAPIVPMHVAMLLRQAETRESPLLGECHVLPVSKTLLNVLDAHHGMIAHTLIPDMN